MENNHKKIIIIGAAGFIGTNLIMKLAENQENCIVAVDSNLQYFSRVEKHNYENVIFREMSFDDVNAYDDVLSGQEYVFHLVSTTAPTTSNVHIPEELRDNVINTSFFLEACIRKKIKRVIFLSSGGTVYGKEHKCPLSEDLALYPISSYGIQKITIENLLYLYKCQYGLDYRVVRLSNPYGPFQRPDGILGAVTTFTYRALCNQDIIVYGDGTIVRDFIYIDDAIKAILNVAFNQDKFDVFNVGSGIGVSICDLLLLIQKIIPTSSAVIYKQGRKVDVPINYLDITRYQNIFGEIQKCSLEDGILKTAEFLKQNYNILSEE